MLNKKKSFQLLILLTVSLFLFPKITFAKEMSTFYRGLRPAGMGNAFLCVADDENALFYNPAGLSKVDSFDIQIFNPLFEYGENALNFYNDLSDKLDKEDVDGNDVADLLNNYYGETIHTRLSFFPNTTFNLFGLGIGVGYLGQAVLDAQVNNPSWPNLDVAGRLDQTLVFGGGYKLPSIDLRIGATAKIIHRQNLDETYTPTEIANEIDIEDDLKSGDGMGVDIGAIYTFPVLFNPSVGLVVQDLGDTGLGDAGENKQQINFGAAANHSFWIVNTTVAMDINDLESGEDFTKKLHLGAEFKFPKILAIQAGINQGYFTAGTTIDFWLLEMGVATYAEEIGEGAGQKADRRYMWQIAMGF